MGVRMSEFFSILIDFIKQIENSGSLPLPVVEHRFHPVRRWRFDYALPKHYLAFECEGGVWSGGRHTRGKGFLKDMEKYNTAQLMGWTVYRFTPQMVRSGEALDLYEKAIKGKNVRR